MILWLPMMMCCNKGDANKTAYAAARVAGAAALVRHKFPDLSGMQVKDILLQSATDIGDPGVDDKYGHGALDLRNAMSPQGPLTP